MTTHLTWFCSDKPGFFAAKLGFKSILLVNEKKTYCGWATMTQRSRPNLVGLASDAPINIKIIIEHNEVYWQDLAK